MNTTVGFNQRQPEQDRAPVLGGRGGAAAAHPDRFRLWDEFSAHAGTSVGKRLSIRLVADGGIRLPCHFGCSTARVG